MIVDCESLNCDPNELDKLAVLAQVYCDKHRAEIDVHPRRETGCGGGLQLDTSDPRYHYLDMVSSAAVEWAWDKFMGHQEGSPNV